MQTEVSLSIGRTVQQISEAISRHAVIESNDIILSFELGRFRLSNELGEVFKTYMDCAEAAWGFIRKIDGEGKIVITETLL